MAVAVDTTQQVVARVRNLLRRVDDLKLPEEAIIMAMNQCLTAYLRKRKLRFDDRATERKIVTLSATEIANDYVINGAPADSSISALEYEACVNESMLASGAVTLVPLSAWREYAAETRIVGSDYGNNRIRLNMAECDVLSGQWVLTYRDSLLRRVQLGQKPALPAANLPMLEYGTAIRSMPMVADDSKEWVAWMQRTVPIYAAIMGDEVKDWIDELESSSEPQIQPIIRSDRHRQGGRRVRAYVPPS